VQSTNDLIANALEAKRRGDRTTAESLLREAVAQDARNGQAWLYLSEVVPELEEAVVCLVQASAQSPGNVFVGARLVRLRRLLEAQGRPLPETRGRLLGEDDDLNLPEPVLRGALQRRLPPTLRRPKARSPDRCRSSSFDPGIEKRGRDWHAAVRRSRPRPPRKRPLAFDGFHDDFLDRWVLALHRLFHEVAQILRDEHASLAFLVVPRRVAHAHGRAIDPEHLQGAAVRLNQPAELIDYHLRALRHS
jgi:hypothetical protein